ncbi:MAG: ATP-binding protein [Anaerolineae bacterium]
MSDSSTPIGATELTEDHQEQAAAQVNLGCLTAACEPADAPEVPDARDMLLRISRDIAGKDALDQTLQAMVDAALLIVQSAEKCVIHLLDDTGEWLVARVCSDPSPVIGRSGISTDTGVAGRALRECTTICVDDTSQSPDYAPLHSGPAIGSLIVAPLYVGDERLGTLSLTSRRRSAFSPSDHEHIRTLSAQASVAVRQAKLLAAATAERERADAIIESISDGLAILDGEGRVTRLNPALHHLLEIEADQVALPCPLEHDAMPPTLRILLNPASGVVMGPYVVTIPLPSGREVFLQVTPSPLAPPASGEVRIAHDVTGEREAVANRALFISQVAHELRTPLQHIMGFTSLISDIRDLPGEQRDRFFTHIQDETKRLARLVEDLVELSRIETGHFSVVNERIRLDGLIEDTVGKLLPSATFKNLTLTLHSPPVPLWAHTDPVRLEQVLCNLVENAFKFVPPGGSVDVYVEPQGSDVQVSVVDSGPGIPQDELSDIFGHFYQIPTARKRNSGLGLGLYISRKIVHALHGDIWAESELGHGSTFRFRIPLLVNTHSAPNGG